MPPKSLPVKYNYAPEEEILLKEWCERATILRILHHKSWTIYRRKNIRFTIPIIILTTVCGTLNVAQSRVPAEHMAAATIGIGVLNLIAGIMTTISGFLEIAKMETSHRTMSLNWGKYARHWSTELARAPKDRIPVQEAMRSAKSEFDRLAEQSPPISQKVLDQFQAKNKDKIPVGYTLPEILDSFNLIRIYDPNISKARCMELQEREFSGISNTVRSQINTSSAHSDTSDVIDAAV